MGYRTPSSTRADDAGALPPGPRMPQPLQALGWALRPLPFMEKCRRRYGDAFTLRVRRGRPWVFLSDPADVGKVLTISPELVRAGAGEANPLLVPLLGQRSVMLLDEPEHMAHRRFMLPAFHGARMRGYGEMMAQVAREQIASWPVGEPFALWPRMQAISNEVVMRATFGSTEGPRMDNLRALLQRLTDWLNDSSRLTLLATFGSQVLSRNRRFRELMAPVEAALLEEVRRRRAAGPRPEDEGILSMLEQAYDESGRPMTDQELRDELITLLSDGPTATSLSWTFERLLRHPEKMARLQAEVLGGEGEEYTEAVVKEILRLVPAVPVVMRGLVEPMELGGHTIPAGTLVAPAIYLVHHREDIYPRPFAFMPERFLASSAHRPGAGKGERTAENYAWLPFGSGVRRCVAATFAPLEMRHVIRAVIEQVELAAAPTGGVQRPTRSSVSFAPGDEAPVVVRRRRSPEERRRSGTGGDQPRPPAGASGPGKEEGASGPGGGGASVRSEGDTGTRAPHVGQTSSPAGAAVGD
ncbi:MAG TPA: cytochrome P450 [Solirubrobacteraceae bacterium]|nr:cytochrome P450 [Solirubrobacteraceae bacterium]